MDSNPTSCTGLEYASDLGGSLSILPRTGIGARTGVVVWGRFEAPAIAAFRTCAQGGFTPQVKHGGRGVCAFAVEGSKLEGTGFEKAHIGHTHVALFAGVGSAGGRWKGLSDRAGDDVALLDGIDTAEICLFWTDDRFDGFGTSVILAEDFKNPALLMC